MVHTLSVECASGCIWINPLLNLLLWCSLNSFCNEPSRTQASLGPESRYCGFWLSLSPSQGVQVPSTVWGLFPISFSTSSRFSSWSPSFLFFLFSFREFSCTGFLSYKVNPHHALMRSESSAPHPSNYSSGTAKTKLISACCLFSQCHHNQIGFCFRNCWNELRERGFIGRMKQLIDSKGRLKIQARKWPR